MVDVEHGYAGFQHDLPMKKGEISPTTMGMSWGYKGHNGDIMGTLCTTRIEWKSNGLGMAWKPTIMGIE